MTKILLSLAGAQELGHTPPSSLPPSCSPKESPEHPHSFGKLQHWHSWKQKHPSFSPASPQAAQGWGSSTSKPQDIVAQAQGTARALAAPVPNSSAGSLLHSTYFIRFRAGQITKCTKWRPHYQKQDCGLQQHSYGPEAFGRIVERAGWVRGLLLPTAFEIPQGQTLFISGQSSAEPHSLGQWGSMSPNCLERTDRLKPAVGRGKCSEDLKCCATHIHTSKSLNPHPFWSQTFPWQDSLLTTLQEIRWW